MSLIIPKTHLKFTRLILFLLAICFSNRSLSQSSTGFLKGKLVDGATFKPLFGATILKEGGSDTATTAADGYYILQLKEGSCNVSFTLAGFQDKIIMDIPIQPGQVTQLDVILFPLAEQSNDDGESPAQPVSPERITFHRESVVNIYNKARHNAEIADVLAPNDIDPATDKNGAFLLKRLNGIVVYDNPFNLFLNRQLTIGGMGERYNQVLLNGAVLNSFTSIGRSYPLDLFPAEIIEQASVQQIANASLPSDFAGGNIEIKTKDKPDKDFYYVQLGGGFSDNTNGKTFLGDKRNKWEWLSFPGAAKDLSPGFPTIRSRATFDQKNPQEQVDFSRTLNNNLAPVDHGNSKPDDRIVIGFGKTYKLKKGERIGIIAFLTHQRAEIIDESAAQAAPDIISNPYPFSAGSQLIRSQSQDVNYRAASQLSGNVNGSIVFGHNKISVRNFFGSQFITTYSARTALFKPDEDTLAHTGIRYLSEQKRFLNTQVSGEHALGKGNRLKLEWLASYLYCYHANPDERNFLLSQNVSNSSLYQLAQQSTASLSSAESNFTNSGRQWTNFKDHNFSGSVKLSVPFSIVKRQQVLTGGIYVQTQYRIFYTDLYLTRGPGYYTLDKLLAPERYFPGGLSITNYFVKNTNTNFIFPNHRGSYTGSANTGSSFLMLQSQVLKSLNIDWGIRMESNSYLVSNTVYQYFTGFKNARIIPIDENTRVTAFNFLPSVNVKFLPRENVEAHAAYFKTINRPQLQELTNSRYYDAAAFLVKAGNNLLSNSEIDNYDAGVNWFVSGGTNVSVSGFYKKLYQPVEYVLSAYANAQGNLLVTPHNMPSAEVKGLIVSFRIKPDFISSIPWLSHVTLFGSGSLLDSKVDAGPIKSVATPNTAGHALTGTPDYTVNAGLTVQQPGYPYITVLYSRTGDYINAVGSGTLIELNNGNKISAIPDYRVKGREQLDIQLSQRLFKSRFQVIVGVNNLLKSPYIEYQDLNGNKKFDSELQLISKNGKGGYYAGGVDNTLIHIQPQRSYYLSLSYLFN